MRLLPKDARIIGQGITGAEGSTSLPAMLEYGTNIVAGVTPGKGGQTLPAGSQGLKEIPIFNTVKEAVAVMGEVHGTVQFVPPVYSKMAAVEAIDAGLKFTLIGAEKVPTKDSAILYEYAKKNGASIIGPSSVGLISPHRKIKIGAIGGSDPGRVFADGDIAVISKSGGMTSEIGLLLKNHGMGVSWAVGIGGDRIICTDFVDFLLELENDDKTKASIVFGELGGTYEEKIGEFVKSGKIRKPVVAFIAGDFTTALPSDVQFGHAGAIIEGIKGMPAEKRRILKEFGVYVAEKFDDIPTILKKL